jgi:hypothetical protein
MNAKRCSQRPAIVHASPRRRGSTSATDPNSEYGGLLSDISELLD